MGGNVIGRLTVISAFGQPLPNRFAIGRSVILAPATETKLKNKLIDKLLRILRNVLYQKVDWQERQTIRLALLSLARIIMLQLGPGQKRSSGWERT